jgi:hypothetical protein
MAFPGTGLTELGPYGVPVAITIPLFGEGAPLTVVVAEGIISIEEISHGQITLEQVNQLAANLNTTLEHELVVELESQGLIGHPESQGKVVVEVDTAGVVTIETFEVSNG